MNSEWREKKLVPLFIPITIDLRTCTKHFVILYRLFDKISVRCHFSKRIHCALAGRGHTWIVCWFSFWVWFEANERCFVLVQRMELSRNPSWTKSLLSLWFAVDAETLILNLFCFKKQILFAENESFTIDNSTFSTSTTRDVSLHVAHRPNRPLTTIHSVVMTMKIFCKLCKKLFCC